MITIMSEAAFAVPNSLDLLYERTNFMFMQWKQIGQ